MFCALYWEQHLGVLWPEQRESDSHFCLTRSYLSINAAKLLGSTSHWWFLLSRESTKTSNLGHAGCCRLIPITLHCYQPAFWTQVENLKVIPIALHLVRFGSLSQEAETSFLSGPWFCSQQKPFLQSLILFDCRRKKPTKSSLFWTGDSPWKSTQAWHFLIPWTNAELAVSLIGQGFTSGSATYRLRRQVPRHMPLRWERALQTAGPFPDRWVSFLFWKIPWEGSTGSIFLK